MSLPQARGIGRRATSLGRKTPLLLADGHSSAIEALKLRLLLQWSVLPLASAFHLLQPPQQVAIAVIRALHRHILLQERPLDALALDQHPAAKGPSPLLAMAVDLLLLVAILSVALHPQVILPRTRVQVGAPAPLLVANLRLEMSAIWNVP